MSRKTDYTNQAQQRLLRVILALFSDVVNGLTVTQVAKAADCSAPNAIRDLDNLRTAGFAERDEEAGVWRLTARLPQQAIKVWTSIDRAERRLADARARFSRNAD
ncbi:MAG: IclR family transcriptional regulator [Bordetella sp. SCN 67-23]|nr:IclR family transcriptional regulator [Burkholderiales bacterium]ODS75900.1 MAG: IclR family transcriptional regulator [Bordetella sp. SCN 67-23]OJW91776.1 MAG: IclR family transcriptional regulator [Burkholderiales bacterium 67-32]